MKMFYLADIDRILIFSLSRNSSILHQSNNLHAVNTFKISPPLISHAKVILVNHIMLY